MGVIRSAAFRLGRAWALGGLLAAAAGCADEGAPGIATANGAHQTVGGDAVVNVDALNFRAGPSRSAEILSVMHSGDHVRIRGETVDGYAPVTFDGRDGWAWEEFLSEVGPAAPPASLPDAIAALAQEVAQRSPRTELAIAVRNLSTDEYAGSADDVQHVSIKFVF